MKCIISACDQLIADHAWMGDGPVKDEKSLWRCVTNERISFGYHIVVHNPGPFWRGGMAHRHPLNISLFFPRGMTAAFAYHGAYRQRTQLEKKMTIKYVARHLQ